MSNSIKKDVTSNTENRFPHDVQIKLISRPLTYISQIPLPDVWKKLPQAFNGWLNISERDVEEIEEICQVYQYGEMILDDIQDDRQSRGSIKTAHIKYGMPETINAYLYSYTEFGRRLKVYNPSKDALTVRKDAVVNTCKARATRLHWRDASSCPTEEEYYEMIIQQTYLLLTVKIKIMQMSSKNKQDFARLCGMFGLYLQILEDYRRLSATSDEAGDLYGEDITLGRFSLPIIHALRTQPEGAKIILDIYRLRSKEKVLKDYILLLLEKFGSFQYTKNVLDQLRQEIVKEMKTMETNSRVVKFMEQYFELTLDDHVPTATDTKIMSSFIAQIDQPQSQASHTIQIERVLRPARHFESLSITSVGKFVSLFKAFVSMPAEKFGLIQFVLHTIQAASFIVDDIQDASELRRGIPCAHLVFGVASTLNSGIYLLARIIEKLLTLDDMKAIDIYEVQFARMLLGQGMDIYWREHFICPTEVEYLDMMSQKTNAVFFIIGRLMSLFSSNGINYDRLMETLGQYGQIMDDYHNLTNESYFTKKGFCEDFTEGKFGFPVVHAVHTHPKEGQIITDILRQRTQDVELKKYCLSLLEKCGSLDYTKNRIKDFRDIIVQEITACGASIHLVEALDRKFAKCDI